MDESLTAETCPIYQRRHSAKWPVVVLQSSWQWTVAKYSIRTLTTCAHRSLNMYKLPVCGSLIQRVSAKENRQLSILIVYQLCIKSWTFIFGSDPWVCALKLAVWRVIKSVWVRRNICKKAISHLFASFAELAHQFWQHTFSWKADLGIDCNVWCVKNFPQEIP